MSSFALEGRLRPEIRPFDVAEKPEAGELPLGWRFSQKDLCPRHGVGRSRADLILLSGGHMDF